MLETHVGSQRAEKCGHAKRHRHADSLHVLRLGQSRKENGYSAHEEQRRYIVGSAHSHAISQSGRSIKLRIANVPARDALRRG